MAASNLTAEHYRSLPRARRARQADGRLTAEEFAVKHRLNLGYLLERLAAGEIPAERVDRQGRAVERDMFIAAGGSPSPTRSRRSTTSGVEPAAARCYAPRRRLLRRLLPRAEDLQQLAPEEPGEGEEYLAISVPARCRACGAPEPAPAADRAEDAPRPAALMRATCRCADRDSLLYLSPGALRSVVTPERRELGRRAHGRLGVNAREVPEALA